MSNPDDGPEEAPPPTAEITCGAFELRALIDANLAQISRLIAAPRVSYVSVNRLFIEAERYVSILEDMDAPRYAAAAPTLDSDIPF